MLIQLYYFKNCLWDLLFKTPHNNACVSKNYDSSNTLEMYTDIINDNTLSIHVNNPNLIDVNDMKDYENISKNNYHIYDNINNLITNNPDINTSNNIIIFLINWPHGFGSALTVFIQNMYYINNLNPNIITLPHFSQNNNNFKYSENNYNNSFFLYFKYKKIINNLSSYKILFAYSTVLDNIAFFESGPIVMSSVINKSYITLFNDKFKYIKNEDVLNKITIIKNDNKPLLGIHIRSIMQKKIHQIDYISIPLIDRLKQLKIKIDNEYDNYNIFIITDVSLYLNLAQSIFNKIYFIKNINRINSEDDSIPLLEEYTGYKLGMDILNECFALSLCNKIYISNSNIPFIISIMNPDIIMEDY